MSEERSFLASVEASYEANAKRFNNTLNIAVIGTVSAGKSSLINALLGRNRTNMIAPVGPESGTTGKLHAFKLDEHVRIIDSPGLGDIRKENSDLTIDFVKFIDIGILVVTGSADAIQRSYLSELDDSCARTFVVLNKIDHYDKYGISALSALNKVETQWKTALNIGSLYKICCFGYDPDTDPDVPLDIRGIDDLRKDIESFLASKGKDLLLARHLNNKEHEATKIISTALAFVALSSLSPGAAVIIMGAQMTAIYNLYYLYTGKFLARAVVINIILAVSGQATVTQLILFVKSFIPGTVIGDIAASYAAVLFTFTLLSSFTKILARGVSDLAGEELLKEFKSIKRDMNRILSESNKSNWLKQDFWNDLIKKILF